jgi:hypothetical protein
MGGTGAFAARGFFRSGLVCFATLSHNSRSSALNARLRRGAGDSGVSSGRDERFIGLCGRNERSDNVETVARDGSI